MTKNEFAKMLGEVFLQAMDKARYERAFTEEQIDAYDLIRTIINTIPEYQDVPNGKLAEPKWQDELADDYGENT